MKKGILLATAVLSVFAAAFFAFFAFGSPRDAADMAVRFRLGIWDLSDFAVKTDDVDPQFFTYYYRPGGFGTYESVRVDVQPPEKLIAIESDMGEVFRAMRFVSDQQLEKAEAELLRQVVEFPEATDRQFRLMVREDGCLYLYIELIVEAEPGENPPCENHWHKDYWVKVSDT